jgi:hypothetical protein
VFLAGIQEEKGRGLWVSILEMDRKQVVKKYRKARCFFHPCTDFTAMSDFLTGLYNDEGLWVRKKQFSQLGRPPKYRQVPPRILFRPEGGGGDAEYLALLSSLRIPPSVLISHGNDQIPKTLPCECVGPEALLDLARGVLEEKRLHLETVCSETQKGLFMATAIALWGGEKNWRLVRYGG